MNTKKFGKNQLRLNKKTIAHLTEIHMKSVNGGGLIFTYDCTNDCSVECTGSLACTHDCSLECTGFKGDC